ncbi:hypothetical protein B566_EDAN018618, partial [Ephemera danica]
MAPNEAKIKLAIAKKALCAFQTGVLTLLLLPVRVLAIAVLLVVAWLLACIGLIGLSEHELRERPLVGWR